MGNPLHPDATEPSASILLVDDKPANLLALEAVLEPLGTRLVKALSGEDALRVLLREDSACVLLDVQMPGLSGFETAALIQRRERSRHVPILFLTASEREEAHVVRGYAHGAVDYLVKPFDPEMLKTKVQVFVDFFQREQRSRREVATLRRNARDENDQLRILIHSVQDYGIFMLDADGVVTTWNEGAERIKGYRPEEILGQHFSRFYPPEAVAQSRPELALRIAAAEGRYAEEGWRIRKDGSRFWASVVITALRDESGAVRAFGKVTRDLTERKRHEDDQAFLDQVTGILTESLQLDVTLEKAVQLAVPHLADFCQVKVVGESGESAAVAVAHRDKALEEMVRSRVTAGPVQSTGHLGDSYVLRSGEPQLIPDVSPDQVEQLRLAMRELAPVIEALGLRSLLSVPLKTAQSSTLGVLSLVMTGDSGRRFGPADLAFAQEFARRCALALENARLFQKTSTAVRLRDEFLSVAAHELRTPLTSLKLQHELIGRALERQGLEAEVKRLSIAQRQETRLSSLVERLLDVSRISTGRMELELSRVDLADLVRDALDRVRMLFDKAGSAITLHAPEHVVGHWDAPRLDQVVVNLLSNAAKYGAGKPVEVRVEASDGFARLVVRDQGIGIAAEALPRIFGLFERAVSNRHFGGMGIGLYLSKQTVEALGGDIQVQSSPDEGTSMTVRLPLNS